MNEDEEQLDPTSFLEFAQSLGGGECVRYLTEALHELTLKMRHESVAQNEVVKGGLVLNIKLSHAPTGIVSTAYEIKQTPPPKKTSGSIHWSTKAGQLVRQDPAQVKLPLNDIGAPRKPRDLKN